MTMKAIILGRASEDVDDTVPYPPMAIEVIDGMNVLLVKDTISEAKQDSIIALLTEIRDAITSVQTDDPTHGKINKIKSLGIL